MSAVDVGFDRERSRRASVDGGESLGGLAEDVFLGSGTGGASRVLSAGSYVSTAVVPSGDDDGDELGCGRGRSFINIGLR